MKFQISRYLFLDNSWIFSLLFFFLERSFLTFYNVSYHKAHLFIYQALSPAVKPKNSNTRPEWKTLKISLLFNSAE